MQQLHGPKIHIQIELESQTEQNLARMLVPRNTRIAERAQQDRVDIVAEMLESVVRERLFCLQIVFSGIRQAFPLHSKTMLRGGSVENRHGRCDDLRYDS